MLQDSRLHNAPRCACRSRVSLWIVKSALSAINSSPSATPKIFYNGLHFSPGREFVEHSIVASQKSVNGSVRCRAYKGMMTVLGRWSDTEKLYDASESSMDEIWQGRVWCRRDDRVGYRCGEGDERVVMGFYWRLIYC